MSARAASMPFPARLRTELKLDSVLLALVLALLLGGFVILASASISISDNTAGNPFFYVQRQLLAAAIGALAAGFCRRLAVRNFWAMLPRLFPRLTGFHGDRGELGRCRCGVTWDHCCCCSGWCC